MLRWRFYLSDFQYEILYRCGKRQVNADALSRNIPEPDPASINVVTRRRAKELSGEENPQERIQPIRPAPPPPRISTRIRKPTEKAKALLEEKKEPIKKTVSKKVKENQEISKEKGSDEGTSSSSDSSGPIVRRIRKRKLVKKKPSETQWEDLPQEPYSDDSESNPFTEKEVSESSRETNIKLVNLKFSKESLEYSRDNVIYFVNPAGNPIDEGARKFFNKDRVELKSEYTPQTIVDSTIGKRQSYGLCLSENESVVLKRKKLLDILLLLKSKLIKNNIKSFSLAKSANITNIPWQEFIAIFSQVYFKTDIDITVYTATLIYVPSEKREEIFDLMHVSPLWGHSGVTKTVHRIKQKYFWENLKEDIRKRIQFCINCQLKKLTRVKVKQPMHITDTPSTVFEKVAMDIVGPLTETPRGNTVILTIQCQLSRHIIAIALPNSNAETIASAFIKRCICQHGCPRILLTDQGSNFLSVFMQKVAKRFRMKQVKTTAYHPMSNGVIERSHHVLAEFLKQYVSKDDAWDEWLELATFSYNTSLHESLGYSPHEVVYGQPARLPSDGPLTQGEQLPTYNNYLEDLVARLIGIRKLAHDNIILSKERNKRYYDKHLHVQEFKRGDFVFLLKGKKPRKFEDQYTGPFRVDRVLNNYNVRIRMGKKLKVVHSNRLKIAHIN